MKKIIIYAAFLAGFAIPSCQRAGMDDAAEESFSLTVNVDGINTGVESETRALAETVEGESDIANLHLLFFDHSADGKGKFVYDYVIETPVAGSPITLKIGGRLNEKLSNSKDYSILAFANMDEYMDVNGFTALLTDAPEDEVMKRLPELKNFEKFQLKSLPMSGTTVKKAGQQLVELNLTRAVSRFDVYNSVSDKYDLVSVSIFNAAKKTRIWDGDFPIVQSYTDGKFYGLKPENPVTKIMGSLYAFENSVGDPAKNHDGTTALVIGLKKNSSDDAQPMYYRVGVHPDGSGQNLVRNHVYKVTVNAVLKAGATSEAEAETGGLDAVINNWDLDEDGMVVTDGQNIMAIPSKYIRFGPAAESLAYDIYTHGEGKLSIIEKNLPTTGITVELVNNRLTVAVDEWPDGIERGGTVELGFGTLRGKVEIVQSPASVDYLRLTPGTVPMFDAMGEDRGQTVSVSASGRWKAVIYNPVGKDLGFSFAGSGTVDIESGSDEDGAFDVYTLGPNTKNDILRGFIIVSLVDKPEYKQVVMLSQNTKTPIRISPSYDGFHFDVRGFTIEKADDRYVIDVQPMYDKNGVPRQWYARLEGGNNVQFFDLLTDPADPYRLELVANGNETSYPGYNLTGEDMLNVNLRIGIDDVDYILLPVKQDKLIFSVEPFGRKEVPVKGSKRDGVYQDYVEHIVTLNPQLKWKAEIVKQSHEVAPIDKPWTVHKGFFIGDDRKSRKDITALPASGSTMGSIRIGFEKIWYPLINEKPTVEIKISIVGLESHDLGNQTIKIIQEALLPRPMKIQTYQIGYGGLGIDQTAGVIGIAGQYNPYLMSSHLFSGSNNSMVKTAAPGITKATAYIYNTSNVGCIIDGVSYVQLNTEHAITSTHLTDIKKWWESDDRNLLVTSQEHASHSEIIYKELTEQKGYAGDGDNTGLSYINQGSIDGGKRAMLFMIQDGPATGGERIGDPGQFHADAINTGLTKWPVYAVPILQWGNSSNPTHMSIVVDPVNNYIFYGEMQNFRDASSNSQGGLPGAIGSWNNQGYFLANLLAYVVNASQYGSHFTDMFIQLKKGDKGYDAEAEKERAQRYEYAKIYWMNNMPENW